MTPLLEKDQQAIQDGVRHRCDARRPGMEMSPEQSGGCALVTQPGTRLDDWDARVVLWIPRLKIK